MTCILLVLCVLWGERVPAADPLSPRKVSELGEVKTDRAFRVKKATVTYLNPDGLAARFPEVARAIERGKIPSWNSWIVENFAVLSETQADLEGFSTPIEVDKEMPIALYRQTDENRTGTVEAKLGAEVVGLMNLKGIGNPPETTGLNGLLSHEGAIAETERQQAVQRNADAYNATHPNANYQTVPTLFILALEGFITDSGEPMRAAIEGREATRRHKDDVVFVPKELGLTNVNRAHQASISGALMDFGVTEPETPDNRFEFLPVDPKSRTQNDRVHTRARQAAEAYEKGNKRAVQELLNPTPIERVKSLLVESMNHASFDFTEQQFPPEKDVPQDLRVLNVYLHTEDENLRNRLSFSLASYYQRDPEAFERAVDYMSAVAADLKKMTAAFENFRQAIFDHRAGKMSKADLEDAKERFETSGRPERVLKFMLEMQAQATEHVTGEKRPDTPLERAFQLAQRAIFDRDLYPFGAHYYSHGGHVPDLVSRTRIPENAILFLSEPGVAHRRNTVLQLVRGLPGGAEYVRKMEWESVYTYLEQSLDADRAHPIDLLVPKLDQASNREFDIFEQLRRTNYLFDHIGDPPIERNSLHRILKLEELREAAERLHASEPVEAGSVLHPKLREEAALLAARLGSKNADIAKTLKDIAQKGPLSQEKVDRVEKIAANYEKQVRAMLAEHVASISFTTQVLQSMKEKEYSADHMKGVKLDLDVHAILVNNVRRIWPDALTKEEMDQIILSAKVVNKQQFQDPINLTNLFDVEYELGGEKRILQIANVVPKERPSKTQSATLSDVCRRGGAQLWELLKRLWHRQ